ncbi:glycosyltransferase family 4 protein [Hoeflea prorocentri]|uniref:Glycosyltransferase family 4 protein n=1 Tax=Hoeflea prorocentri TaxID=1922333 RepID=A0A9X3UFC5_9HYPH|nr:glycosyltransferase family 4 protein [Hoeflea prorocentri]MCY6379584.1 glycosyltransferase family 4 protein [Hoeflea prorocentri]MDA5397384.1 glycosyltransferase family 4 protein [Hoeflea prorocentri]
MADHPELIVTNMHRNFTGVSSTAAAVARLQAGRYDMRLVGRALTGCPAPISSWKAFSLSRKPPAGRSHILWHVRRNNEMRAALFARDLLKLPVRIVFTSAAKRRHSALPRWLISRMDAVIATTDEAAALVPNVRAIVHHGVDTGRFHPADDRDEAWRATGYPGRLGIATIGRIRPEKGTDLFVDAMIRLLPDLPDATALVIGKATPQHRAFAADLQRRIDAAGLSKRIVFTGELPAEETAGLIRALSLLVAPPRYEGYGMTPLEAMASGVPIVASRTGFFARFVDEDKAGTIVSKVDAASLSQAVRDLIDNPMELALKSSNARNRAVEQFGIEREIDGLHNVYETLWNGS